MTHMKRDHENTLCMAYLPRVKKWTTDIREATCPACRKQMYPYLLHEREKLEAKLAKIDTDLKWVSVWYLEEIDVQS